MPYRFVSCLMLVLHVILAIYVVEGNIVCPNFWVSFNDGCYQFNTTNASWFRAKKSCEAQHAHLLVIETPDEDAFVATELQQLHRDSAANTANYWIAGNDLDTEAAWEWDHRGGQPINYTNWGPGEPNNWKNPEGMYAAVH